MTEKNNSPLQEFTPAEPDIQPQRSMSIVWIVPLVALVIGGWLAYKAVTEKGPMVTITFDSADGIEAGKTKVKFKEVEVGRVEVVEIGENLAQVVLKVQMKKGSEPYLTENTRFWVVRARVSAGQVTGLGTLFGGAYIGVEPSAEGESVRKFRGLEKPPIVSGDVKGKRFNLTASRLGSLTPGSPIYFRQINVGQVVDFNLDEGGESVGVSIFIQSPYDLLVRRNTRFWLASGLDFELTANGVRVNTESVVSLMIGGISFNTFPGEDPEPEAEDGDQFTLYATELEANDDRYTEKIEYYVEFTDSVRGLSVGAPVEFRGIQIGSVLDISLKADFDTMEFSTMVLIRIERQRISLPEDDEVDHDIRLKRMVHNGFRVQLKSGNLLTGQLFVDLEHYQDVPEAEITMHNDLPVLPSIPSSSQVVMQGVASFVKKLDHLPLEEIGKDLQGTLKGINRLVSNEDLGKAIHSLQGIMVELETASQSINRDTFPRVNKALAELEVVLSELDGLINADAPLVGDLRATLQQFHEAARAITSLADLLARHPEALLQGRDRVK